MQSIRHNTMSLYLLQIWIKYSVYHAPKLSYFPIQTMITINSSLFLKIKDYCLNTQKHFPDQIRHKQTNYITETPLYAG